MVGNVLYKGHEHNYLTERRLSSPMLFLSSMPLNFIQPCIPSVNIKQPSLHTARNVTL